MFDNVYMDSITLFAKVLQTSVPIPGGDNLFHSIAQNIVKHAYMSDHRWSVV